MASPDPQRHDEQQHAYERREQQQRSISRMAWIVFILAAIAGLLSILFTRPVPAQSPNHPEITRST